MDKVIFVLEEIDTASHITQQRPTGNEADEEEQFEVSKVTFPIQQGNHEGNKGGKGATGTQNKGGKGGTDVGPTDLGAAIGDAIGEAVMVARPPFPPWPNSKGGRGVLGDDTLNLGGLLEVLDGVVDSPGRILIMTTNHPENLDEAITRAGRVNQRIFLGYMTAQCAKEMLESLTFDHGGQLDQIACELLEDFFTHGLKQLGFGPGTPDGELEDYGPQVTPAELMQLWQWEGSLATDSSIVQTIIDLLVSKVGAPCSVTEDIRKRAKKRESQREAGGHASLNGELGRTLSGSLVGNVLKRCASSIL